MPIRPKNWSAEELERLPVAQLKSLRDNALRLGQDDLAARCSVLIPDRAPAPAPRRQPAMVAAPQRFVAGYHFVCSRDNGVEELPDGRFWSRTWVVSQEVAESSARYGAYLALHESKVVASYRQGRIERVEVGRRFGNSRTEYGIDFLVIPDGEPRQWVGDGAGEKGYFWQPTRRVVDDGQE